MRFEAHVARRGRPTRRRGARHRRNEAVRRRAFTKDDLVAAGASAAVGEIEHGAGCRPVQAERQRHFGEGFLERESPEPIGDERRSAVSNGDFGERDPRLGGQLEAGRGEEASRGCERGRLSAVLVRRDRRARCPGACGEFLLAQSGLVPDTFEKLRTHVETVSDRIRHRTVAGSPW